jgi:uncharacterized tellurite resistance protein B-like protein
MLDHIKSLLFSPGEPASDDADPLAAAAAAALLIEAAVMDGDFDDTERATITDLLARRFDLEADAVARLIEDGERAVETSVELYGVTRVLKDGLDHDGRLELMEMLWQVVLADGEVHDYEANLVRRVAGLLHVPDKEAGEARKKAIRRLDFDPGAA